MNRKQRDALMSADIAELRGVGDSDVARLVREVDDARALATSIVEATSHANDVLAHRAHARPAPAARVHARPARSARAPVYSALAAALACIIVWQYNRPAPAAVVPVEQGVAATLNASSPRPFAVMATDNPDIAVVWLLPEETP